MDCRRCGGFKKTLGIGGMEMKCPVCKGTGIKKIELKVESVEKSIGPVQAEVIEPEVKVEPTVTIKPKRKTPVKILVKG